MKLEFSAVVKGVPAAEVKCNLECTAEELSVMLSDPVYQELGQKLIREVNFAPKAQPKDANSTMVELDKRLNSVLAQVKRELEGDRKARGAQLHLIEKLMDRAAKLAERTQKF